MAEPGGRSTVSVQLDGMDQAKFALPRSLLVSADNITREYKNQHFATFMADQVATEKFEATEVQFLQAGHTHNEQDQRFSTVASLLSRAPVLEEPQDFADWIRAQVVPPPESQVARGSRPRHMGLPDVVLRLELASLWAGGFPDRASHEPLVALPPLRPAARGSRARRGCRNRPRKLG